MALSAPHKSGKKEEQEQYISPEWSNGPPDQPYPTCMESSENKCAKELEKG
jgi:hypothetical protein